jgi:hypothetical protein
MSWCGSCRRRWVLLVGRGTPEDRDWVPEAICTLRETFEQQGLKDPQCFIGSQIASSMVSRNADFGGVPITYTNQFGGSQVLLSALGQGAPEDWKKDTPAVGSVWWDRVTKDPIRVTSCHLIGNKVFLTVRPDEVDVSSLGTLVRVNQEVPLESFQALFDNVEPVIDRGPIQVGDLWSYLGRTGRVVGVGRALSRITLREENGEHVVEEGVLRKLWTRVRLKSALARLEEDLF